MAGSVVGGGVWRVVELAELIADLRDELTRAVASANTDGLRFELGPVGLEVSVVVAKEAKPGAKVAGEAEADED
jgi:hypothetical protein